MAESLIEIAKEKLTIHLFNNIIGLVRQIVLSVDMEKSDPIADIKISGRMVLKHTLSSMES